MFVIAADSSDYSQWSEFSGCSSTCGPARSPARGGASRGGAARKPARRDPAPVSLRAKVKEHRLGMGVGLEEKTYQKENHPCVQI